MGLLTQLLRGADSHLRLRTLVVAASAFLAPDSTVAQSADSLQHQFDILSRETYQLLRPGARTLSGEQFHTLLQAIAAEQAQQGKLAATISAGLTSDASPAAGSLEDKESHKSDVEIRLSRGTYPSELEVATQMSLSLSGGTFQESISRLFVSYDQYVKPWLEGFVFVDRLSDEFLSIDQRYEGGAGLVFDIHPLDLLASNSARYTAAGVRALDGLTVADSVVGSQNVTPGWLQPYLDARSVRPGFDRMDDSTAAVGAAATARRLRDQAEISVRKRHSRLRVALLVSLLGELEQSTISIPDSPPPSSFAIPGTRTFRWVIRPTVQVRLLDGVTGRADYYYKRAFAGFRDTLDPDRADYRSELIISGTASQNVTQVGRLTATLEFRRLYDNSPPFLDQRDTGGELTQARSQHDRVVLKVGVAF